MSIQTPDWVLQLVAPKVDRRAKNKIFRDVEECFTRIGFEANLGRTGRARKLTYGLLTSHKAKLWALMKAGGIYCPLESLNEKARELDLSTRFEKPVRVYEKRKSSGGTRLICDLPEDLKAAHYIIGELVSCQTNLVDHVYSRRGKGRDALIHDALEAINTGYRHISLLDIKNCFGSINPAFLERLPLHQRFVTNTLRLENLNFAIKDSQKGAIPEADTLRKSSLSYADMVNTGEPTGLMQGSPASSPILARIWNDLPPIDDEKAKVFVYVDEVLIVAKSAASRGEIKDALVRFLADHPAGPLELKCMEVDLRHGFEFLGYEIGLGATGEVEARTSNKTLSKLERLLPQYLERDRLSGQSWPSSAISYMSSVLGGHSAANDRDQWHEVFLETLLEYDLASPFPYE
jgi:hypothetical protein